jgi:hypothetical protein
MKFEVQVSWRVIGTKTITADSYEEAGKEALRSALSSFDDKEPQYGTYELEHVFPLTDQTS